MTAMLSARPWTRWRLFWTIIARATGRKSNHCMPRGRTEIQSLYATREAVNNSGWCVSTLDAALWAFHTTKSFRDGMIAAVNLGGDSDSIGAVYGQIAGAYYGLSAIPAEWKEAVKDWKKVDDFIIGFLHAARCM